MPDPAAVDARLPTLLPAPPPIRLYDWPVSPFCHKVRAVLEHKGLGYERVPALANLGRVRKGGVGKVPALELDGTLLVDSTDIVHALERRFPDRPVLPQDPRARALCHVLEDWTDESLYFLGLWYHWQEPAGRRAARAYFGRTLRGRFLFEPFRWRIERQLWGQGTGRKSPAHIRADLDRQLDAVEALLSDRAYLLDDGPWLCDYALLSQLVYLSRAVSLAGVVEARPTLAAFLTRMREARSGPST